MPLSSRARAKIALFAAVFGGGLVSCSLVLKGDDVQCNIDSDCVAKGAAYANATCVAHACTPPAAAQAAIDAGPLGTSQYACYLDQSADAGSTTTFSGRVIFYDVAASRTGLGTKTYQGFPYAPLVGANVRACSTIDTGCTNLATTTNLKTDDDGAVAVTFREGTPVYLDLQNDAYLPTRFFPPARFRTTDDAFLVGTVTPDSFKGTAEQVGVDLSTSLGPDASTGHLVLASFGCHREPGAGITFSIDDSTGSTLAYIVGGLLNATATATSNEGYAFVFNARVRSTEVRGTYQGVELLNQNALVRPGTISTVYVWP